jgi:hypothetical protein
VVTELKELIGRPSKNVELEQRQQAVSVWVGLPAAVGTERYFVPGAASLRGRERAALRHGFQILDS